jgi:hypothetical protein
MQVAPRVLEVQQARWGTTNQRSQYGIDLFLLLKYKRLATLNFPMMQPPPPDVPELHHTSEARADCPKSKGLA